MFYIQNKQFFVRLFLLTEIINHVVLMYIFFYIRACFNLKYLLRCSRKKDELRTESNIGYYATRYELGPDVHRTDILGTSQPPPPYYATSIFLLGLLVIHRGLFYCWRTRPVSIIKLMNIIIRLLFCPSVCSILEGP